MMCVVFFMFALLYGSYSISGSVLQPINETLIAKHKKQKISEAPGAIIGRTLAEKCDTLDINSDKKVLCTKMAELYTDFSPFAADDLMYLIKYGKGKYAAIDDASKHCNLQSDLSLLQINSDLIDNTARNSFLQINSDLIENTTGITRKDGESCIDFVERRELTDHQHNGCELIKEAQTASAMALQTAFIAEERRGAAHVVSTAAKAATAAVYGAAAVNGAGTVLGLLTGDAASNAASAAAALIDAVDSGADAAYSFKQTEVINFEMKAQRLSADVDVFDECNRPNTAVLHCEINGVKAILNGFVTTTNEALNRLEMTTMIIDANVKETMKDVKTSLSKLNVITGRLQNAIYHEAIQRLVDLRTKFEEESAESVIRYFQFNKQSNVICNRFYDIKSDTETLLTFLKKSILVPSELENTLLYYLRPGTHEKDLWGDKLFSFTEASDWQVAYITEYVYLLDLARFFIAIVSQATRGVLTVLSYSDTLIKIAHGHADNLQFISSHVRCEVGFYLVFHSDTFSCQRKLCNCPNGVAGNGPSCPVNGRRECTACNAGFHLLTHSHATPVFSDCAPNVCTCQHGFAAHGPSCPVNGRIGCIGCESYSFALMKRLDHYDCVIRND